MSDDSNAKYDDECWGADMALEFYGLKTCDTCRKAIKALENAGKELTIYDVRSDGVSKKQLAEWIKDVGWQTLLNTRSTTWRQLSEDEKSDVEDTKALALLVAHPTLMKRPVIVDGQSVYVGWSKPTQQALGL